MTTASEFDRLIAEHEAAEAALNASGGDDARYLAAFRALLQARPVDPATMGRQLRWIVENALDADLEAVLLHVAEQLEALRPT